MACGPSPAVWGPRSVTADPGTVIAAAAVSAAVCVQATQAHDPAADKFCDVMVTMSVSIFGLRFDVTATIGERTVPQHGIYLLTADIADSSHDTNDRISEIKQLPDEWKNMTGTV